MNNRFKPGDLILWKTIRSTDKEIIDTGLLLSLGPSLSYSSTMTRTLIIKIYNEGYQVFKNYNGTIEDMDLTDNDYNIFEKVG